MQAVKNNCVKVVQNVTFQFVCGDGRWLGVGGDQRLCNRSRIEITDKAVLLVKRVRNNGILNEDLEGHDGESSLVGGFEHDGAASAGLLHLQPTCGTDAPAIAGFQASKA